MKIGKYVLAYSGLLFPAFGIAASAVPQMVTEAIHYSLTSPIAQTEFLATYGGLFIGLAAFMLYCCNGRIGVGLMCVLFTMGAMLLTRAAGYALHGSGDLVQYIYLAGELFTVVLVVALLRAIAFGQRAHHQAKQEATSQTASLFASR